MVVVVGGGVWGGLGRMIDVELASCITNSPLLGRQRKRERKAESEEKARERKTERRRERDTERE